MGRYVDLPGQGASYTLEFLKMLELRNRMEQALGADSRLREFHDVVLGNARSSNA